MEDSAKASPKAAEVNVNDNDATNSMNAEDVIVDDKGSTESEESDEELGSYQQQFEASSEFSEITPEEQLMEMAILKNFYDRRRRGDDKFNQFAKLSRPSERMDREQA